MAWKGKLISRKVDERLNAILKTAEVIAESEREKTDVKTSVGRLAAVEVSFLISYITQLEAVIAALRTEKEVMEYFDQAIAEKNDAGIAQFSPQVMEAGRVVEKTLKDLDNWETILE